jgi:uncharacterized protein (TIGR02757 family)
VLPLEKKFGRIAEFLEEIYHRFNDRSHVPPDPLMFVYRYREWEDREVVALIASSVAVGRVEAIASCLERVLGWLGPAPAEFLLSARDSALDRLVRGFRYRFFGEREMRGLLEGVGRVLRRHGSLEDGMRWALRQKSGNVSDALDLFVAALRGDQTDGGAGRLLPQPCRGSACKRLHLFLRWMVRRDSVDPGDWSCIKPAQLLVPLDTHMFRMGRCLGFTARKQADARAAREVTRGFARWAPEDPVRYDFALTRLSMRDRTWLEREGKVLYANNSEGGDP